jgi:hypothetical protein
VAQDEGLQQMDEAAEHAAHELVEAIDRWTARDVVGWWTKWYLKAGHKRLGRILVTQGTRKAE